MIKVDIISGFLGAGKTTFIKELIKKVYKNEKIVLIENEFGEIGIDSRFMQDSGVEVTEMNSGCICCTLVGDFAKSLKQVAEQFAPDRIIIEPSGVGKLSEVEQAVLSVADEAHVTVDNKICVVDGKKLKMYLHNFNEFYKNQIEHATTVVVSRTQSMDESKVKECIDVIEELNHEAAIITTPWEKLDGSVIKSALHNEECCCGHDHHHHDHHDEHCCCGHDHEHHHEHHHHDHHEEHCCCGHDHEHHHDHHHHDEHCCCGHDHDHHHADEVFSSWGAQTVHKFNKTELEDTLKMFSTTDAFGQILRAKGIVETEDGQWIQFDMVPEETEIRESVPDYTGRVCVIGTELNEEYLAQVFGK